MTWAAALASVVLVSAIPLAGLVLVRLPPARLQRILVVLVNFAVGALLGGAFIHLVPEAAERMRPLALSLCVMLGFLVFFVLERALAGRRRAGKAGRVLPRLAVLNLSADALHNLLDGMVIAAAWSAGVTIGLAATAAVVLHEVPQEIGDLAVLLYSGLPVRRAVLFNLLSAATAIAGTLLVLLIGRRFGGFTDALLAVAAGAFVYIAASSLVPELGRGGTRAGFAGQFAFVLLGVALMALPMLVG
jgi:zinc and cadmium transporter